MDDTEKFLGLETKDKNREEWSNKYRTVFFGSHEGTEVLDDILRECGYYDTLNPDNPSAVAIHNMAKVILSKMGLVENGSTVEMLKTMYRLSAVQTTKGGEK